MNKKMFLWITFVLCIIQLSTLFGLAKIGRLIDLLDYPPLDINTFDPNVGYDAAAFTIVGILLFIDIIALIVTYNKKEKKFENKKI